MKIMDCLDVNAINLDIKSKEKNKVLKELFSGLSKNEAVLDEKKCFEDILEREKMGSTGIGKGVAIPHAKTEAVNKIIMTIGIAKQEIEYKSADEENVKILFMFLTPVNMSQEYLILLAKISRYVREEKFREALLKCETNEDVLEVINSKEN
ncbi:PTS sugar transporter subunit IIA [Oceanivirga miroungae]|uniref:PTS transporter subunit IIA-like nitrogen-regulatory protein PtsN n=1 Tax=Oceanivirga miroungae TaxID=1130046 RepID=A0A6I8MCP1_9FUSO|nr:PTS sugar transporter subunit IIA [Oceanivirga miroungae]VWL85252.1 PTS transporter subunit IIA-like nitrogen-regulatory protein PtsN [Oceanivirga miroungae]